MKIATIRYRLIRRVTLVGMIINFSLAMTKLVVGWLGHSQALIADGIHSLSDLASDALVLVAARYAQHAADAEHPYGHQRIETLATLALGVFLCLLALGLIWDTTHGLITGQLTRPDIWTVVAAVISIVANEGLFHYTLAAAKQVNSDLLKANAWHSRSDALSSVVVLAGLLGAIAGWPAFDAIAAILVALLIAKMGVRWGWQACQELIDAGLTQHELQAIKSTITATPGVKQMHMLRTRRMAGAILLDAHILVDPFCTVSEGHYIAERVRFALLDQFKFIEDITIHVDAEDHHSNEPVNPLLSRTHIEQLCYAKWQGIVSKEQIVRLSLNYLNGQLLLDAFIDQRLVTAGSYSLESLRQTLADAVIDQPDIHQLRVYLADTETRHDTDLNN